MLKPEGSIADVCLRVKASQGCNVDVSFEDYDFIYHCVPCET